MKKKKIVSMLVAAAMMLSSAASLATQSFATLLPIKEYDTTLTLEGYTKEELEEVPISTILGGLKYKYDCDIEVPIEEGDSSGTGESPELPVPEGSGVTTSGDVITPATQTVHVNAGDPVEIDPDAVVVLEQYDEYKILDKDSTVDLSSYFSSYTEQFTLIIGSGKQLDQNNVKYFVTAKINRLNYSFDGTAKLYTVDENGEKKYFDNTRIEYSYLSAGHMNVYFYTNKKINRDDKLYVEPDFHLIREDTNETIDCDVEYLYYDSEYSDEPSRMRTDEGYAELYCYMVIKPKSNPNKVILASYIDFFTYEPDIDIYESWASSSVFKSYGWKTREENGIRIIDRYFKLESGFALDDEYEYGLSLNYNYTGKNLNESDVTGEPEITNVKAVLGKYSSSQEAAEDNAVDVTSDFFINSGYISKYNEGVDFTFFIDTAAVPELAEDGASEYVIQLRVTIIGVEDEQPTEPDDPDIPDTPDNPDNPDNEGTTAYFDLIDVTKANGDSVSRIEIDNDYDTYASSKYHYTSWLLYEDEPEESGTTEEADPLDMSQLKLEADSTNGVNVYNSVSGKPVNFETETQDFLSAENSTIQYSVPASKGTGEYWVRLEGIRRNGAKLFVNGPEEREVYLDSYAGWNHDILVANIGDEQLTGLNVEWAEAPKNVKIDDYWVIGGENNDTLAPFTTTYYSEIANLAKIRLVPDGDGEISGTLKISADGQEPEYIKLRGHAGDPEIVTDPELEDAVKYVPYFAIIATNNIYEWNNVSFRRTSGKLPSGVSLNSKTGEIYGVPQETGKFTFEIKADFSSSFFPDVRQEFTIEVLDNTNDNVFNASDPGYTIETSLGTETTPGSHDYYLSSTNTDQLFVSEGEYSDFIDLWLNGEKLVKDEDYTYVEGSTRITIKSQTLRNKTSKGSNTIAAEFRVGGDLKNDLKRTAQNFSIGYSGGSTGGSIGSSSGWRGGHTSVTDPFSVIPESAIKTISGKDVKTESISNDSASFAVFVGTEYAGMFANLYVYSQSKLSFVSAVSVGADGIARFGAMPAGDYAVYADLATHIPGDMDNSLGLNALDASVILRWAAGYIVLDRPEKGDVNGDGVTNAQDASWILKKSVGLI